MTIAIQNGKIVGCEKDGHALILCTDCMVTDMADCPARLHIIKESKKQTSTFKPIGNDYERTALKIANIVTKKQAQYGNSFNDSGNYLRLLYPNGIRPDQYDDMLTLARDYDKSKRIANGNQGNEDAWSDKCGYALLSVDRNRKKGVTLHK